MRTLFLDRHWRQSLIFGTAILLSFALASQLAAGNSKIIDLPTSTLAPRSTRQTVFCVPRRGTGRESAWTFEAVNFGTLPRTRIYSP